MNSKIYNHVDFIDDQNQTFQIKNGTVVAESSQLSGKNLCAHSVGSHISTITIPSVNQRQVEGISCRNYIQQRPKVGPNRDLDFDETDNNSLSQNHITTISFKTTTTTATTAAATANTSTERSGISKAANTTSKAHYQPRQNSAGKKIENNNQNNQNTNQNLTSSEIKETSGNNNNHNDQKNSDAIYLTPNNYS